MSQDGTRGFGVLLQSSALGLWCLQIERATPLRQDCDGVPDNAIRSLSLQLLSELAGETVQLKLATWRTRQRLPASKPNSCAQSESVNASLIQLPA